MDNSELTFRPARPGEQERILEIIGQAQAQMRAAGSDQWQDGYPARADIDADIARGAGPVLCRAHGTIIATGALFFAGAPPHATPPGPAAPPVSPPTPEAFLHALGGGAGPPL